MHCFPTKTLPHNQSVEIVGVRGPANGTSCLKCGKANHFVKVSRSATTKVRFNHNTRKFIKKYSKVHHVAGTPASSDSSSEDEFIFTLKQTCQHKTTPHVQISVNHTPIKMVIDTGTSVDIIYELAFNTLQKKASLALQCSTTSIFAYGVTKQLPVMGKFNATLDSLTGSTTSQIHIIEGNFGCLLSYKTASAMGLIKLKINMVKPEHPTHEQLLNEYAHIFDGIRTLKDFEVKLHIDESVPPVAQPPIEFHFTCDKKSRMPSPS